MAVCNFQAFFFIVIIIHIAYSKNVEQIQSEGKKSLENSLLKTNIEKNAVQSESIDQSNKSRVKRQFGFYPYGSPYPGYYRRPIPIIVGGVGLGRPGFGYGRGFGGRGFGGRGFGGFGRPGGFGARGIGGGGRGGRG